MRKSVGITVFGCEQDEANAFRALSPDFHIIPTLISDAISADNAKLAAGNQCVSVGHKTQSGVRKIPMNEEVYQAFQRVIKNRKGAKPFIIDGYANFLFLKQNGYPMTAVDYGGMFGRLVKKYNKSHEEALPKTTTPHAMRHTFCTRLANAGMNPKALQYIMGHSNITMTLNYYAHATFDSARAEMERLAA